MAPIVGNALRPRRLSSSPRRRRSSRTRSPSPPSIPVSPAPATQSGGLQSGEPRSISRSRGGRNQQANPAEIPQWKAQFLSKPSISVRKGIAFGHDPPSEDTSTLVLTAPSGKFIDIRIPRQISYTDHGRALPIKEHPSYWAFAGYSTTTFYDAQSSMHPGFLFTAHTSFAHVIDSKGPGMMDEGDCFLLPNGDTMEVGIWHETGKLYKEYWTSPEVLPYRPSVALRPVVVVEREKEKPDDERGIIIRIGDYMQSVFEERDAPNTVYKVRIARLIRDDSGKDEAEGNVVFDQKFHPDMEGAWILDARMTSLYAGGKSVRTPFHAAAKRAIHVGEKVDWKGTVWKVTEYIE